MVEVCNLVVIETPQLIRSGWYLDDQTFQLTMAYPRGGDSISLRATSVRDCQLWTSMIDDASQKCRDADKRTSKKLVRTL